jgi:hypothetical protein
MGEGTVDRRGLIRAGAAAAAGVAVGSVVAASPAAAATTDLRYGSVLFAPGELQKVITVPGGLNSTSLAWAAVQAPFPSKLGGKSLNIAATKPDPNAGTMTIEAYEEGPTSGPYGVRFWNVKVAWFVVG